LFDRVNGFIHYVENFNDYLIELGISHDQYVMIKEKLLRLGLLKSSYDDDFQKIVKKVNDITDYTMSLQKGKPKKRTTLQVLNRRIEKPSLLVN
jgi:hypothetical protein